MKSQKNNLEEKLKKVLEEQRGYVYKLPKGTNVVLTMTGGLDSSIAAEMMIKKWQVTVYPFYLKRGATAEEHEVRSAKRVVEYLNGKYPTKIKELFLGSASIPLQEIRPLLSKERIIKKGHPLRNSIIQSYAVQYAVGLNDQGVKTNTILVGSVASDFFTGSTKADLLLNTIYVCANLGEWQWQIISPFFQSGLVKGYHEFKKADLIEWGTENNYPFELTRTCTRGDKVSCGKCEECKERRETFEELGKVDPLRYAL